MKGHPERRFYYSLARELGCANVDRMLAGITSYQISEWQAYSKLDKTEWQMESEQAKHLSNVRG